MEIRVYMGLNRIINRGECMVRQCASPLLKCFTFTSEYFRAEGRARIKADGGAVSTEQREDAQQEGREKKYSNIKQGKAGEQCKFS